MKDRARSLLIWLALGGSALGLASLAIILIHRESAREAANDAQLIAQETERLRGQLEDYFQAIQLESGRQLIAFHEEGLRSQLRRWQDANPLIASTDILAPGSETDELFAGASVDTRLDLESLSAPSSLRSGYYQENRDLAVYESGSARPELAWIRSADTVTAPGRWQVAHRLGPQRPTRVASLDHDALKLALETLLDELAGPSIAASIHSGAGAESAKRSAELEDILPDHFVSVVLGPQGRASNWWSGFGYAMVALCLGLGAACAILLARQAQRERREARRKTSFVSQITHEFKTPLTSIALYADLLAAGGGQSDDKRNRYLETIHRESQRLAGLVDNLLALSAIEQEKKRYRIDLIDVNAAISRVANDYESVLAAAGKRVAWEPLPTAALAKADAAALHQAILNLLDNARKYSVGEAIAVSLRAAASSWEISVADIGSGVPRSLREKIFEAFFQERSLLADKSPGAGLGLSVSRRMLRDCGGDLSLDITYTSGARFTISLPAAAPSPQEIPSA